MHKGQTLSCHPELKSRPYGDVKPDPRIPDAPLFNHVTFSFTPSLLKYPYLSKILGGAVRPRIEKYPNGEH